MIRINNLGESIDYSIGNSRKIVFGVFALKLKIKRTTGRVF